MKNIFLFVAGVLISAPAFAQSGADVLLEDLGGQAKAVQQQDRAKRKGAHGAPNKAMAYAQPSDAFQEQFLLAIQSENDLSFDVKQWAQALLNNQYASAAHLWTSLQQQFPENFRDTADAANVYLLWKLGLHQTFIDQWLKNLMHSDYAKSTAEAALESVIAPGFDGWLLQSAVVISPQQKKVIDKIPATKPLFATLRAWTSLRNAQEAEAILPKLQPRNQLTRLAAQVAAYGHVKQGDIKGAAKILKSYMEPAIESSHNPEYLAQHDLTIARILYQAGQMRAAGEFYKKIPNRSPAYLAAQEELSWVDLRLGNTPELRGELKTLSLPVFKDRFQPEVYLIRAVSDLKMCLYDMVERDLRDFHINNEAWAKRIEAALAKETPPPVHADEYTQLSARAVKNLESEQKQLAQLSEQSIGAVLPAVGPQKHWKDDLADLKVVAEEASKRLTDEYQRQWKNQGSALREAIRKMQFVKVEYLSQVRQLAAAGGLDSKSLVASNGPAAQVVHADSDHTMSFPVDTEIWPDEFFKLRSAAQTLCLKRGLK